MYTPDKFIITNWCGIPQKFIRRDDGSLAIERLIEMKEAGINLIPVSCYGVGEYDDKTICEVLAACHELGLKAMVSDKRIEEAIRDGEHRRELLEAVVRDYFSYPALAAYYVTDEPKCEKFEALGDVCRILEELDPVREAHINILGNRAYEPYWGCETYDEHLSRYMDTVKPSIISYDNYHFRKGEPVTDGSTRGVMFDGVLLKKWDEPAYLDNLVEVRDYAKRYGVPFMVVVLVLEHVTYRDLSEAELRWEVFQSLCYGVKRMSYFTFWEPYADRDPSWSHIQMLNMRGAMVDRNGNRSHHYDEIKRINRELQAIGDILLPYEVKDVFHFGEEPGNVKLAYWQGSYGDVTAMTADNATVGFYEGGYVLVANKDYEDAGDVAITVKEGMALSHYNKANGLWEPSDGKLNLAAGDGELFRIL